VSDPFTLVPVALVVGGWAAWRGIERLLDGPSPSERPDPGLEQAVRDQLGPLPPGLALHVWRYAGPDGRGARIVVRGACPTLSISCERGGQIELGDRRLDERFCCVGPAHVVRALMTAEARTALLRLVESPAVRARSLAVHHGRLSVDVPRGGVRFSGAACADAAEDAVDLVRRLQAPGDVLARLAANALTDPESDVRVANLVQLRHDFPDRAETKVALQDALAHDDPALRLAAALALGEEGRATLVALAEHGDDAIAAAAIEALGTLPLATMRRLLSYALSPRPGEAGPMRPSTARACADVLARSGEGEAVELLADVLAARHTAVALAAVHALRRIGTVAVVAPLHDAARTHPDAEVRAAARGARDDVQMELVDAAPGQLSLSGGDAGAVSLAEDASGRVSLPPAKGAP